ncbi:MAG TPA: TetR/AcrR family transcriptional regulator [Roseiflexaceae bacterium]|nr:TetR/AcrR family transcriptional regulator [Roseiflexaceae bacterium]
MNVQSIRESNVLVAPKDKRATILQAALELIAEHGFHGAPMALVAQRAKVSAGIIYHYFASKEELIRALYQQVEADFNRALLAGSPQSLPIAEAFQQLWLNAYRFYRTHPFETRFLEQYKHSPFYQVPAVPAEVIAGDDFAFLTSIFAADPADRPIKDLPLDVIYELTLGVAARVAHRHALDATSIDEQVLAQIASACWQAIAR